MSKPAVLAIAAHPDDIEFGMAGTMLLLAEAGWELHCINVANGCCGAMDTGPEETAALRWEEAQASARLMNATLYPPLAHDLEITYTPELLKALTHVVRQARPRIVLTHAMEDYMEDHMITGRLAVTATFARGMPNFPATPPATPWEGEVAVYHAMPHGLRDRLGRLVRPGFLVDTASVIDTKEAALACHQSQKTWLDETQGMDSYLHEMRQLSAETARWSASFEHAEGWHRHNPLGFGYAKVDPLRAALGAARHLDALETPRE